MRYSKPQLAKIDDLSERALSSASSSLTSADVETALLHIQWLLGECPNKPDRSENWHRLYTVLFEKIGVEFPLFVGDRRKMSSPENGKLGGRPSTRPPYCTRPDCDTCRLCPSKMGPGRDCMGRLIVGRWGKPVKDLKGQTVMKFATKEG